MLDGVFLETALKGDHFMSQPNVRRPLSVLALAAVLSLAPLSEAMAAPSRKAPSLQSRIGASLTSLWQGLSPIGILKGIIADVGSRWDPNGLD
jgi:hypothetical protein